VSEERLVEVGVPRELRRRSATEPDGLLAAAQRVWSDLGLPSRPRVVATDLPPGTVTVDGRPMALSARRIEQAVLAGSGAMRRPGDPFRPRDLLVERLEALDPSEAQQVVACLVDVALRADVAGLVRADREAIARGRIGPGTTARPLGTVSEAIVIAAEHAVVPRPLAGTEDLPGDDAPGGPDTLAERLVRSWLAAAPPTPTVEASAATLRRLTTGPARLRREHMANEARGPRGLMNDLFLDYGVRPPAVSLRVVDLPESLVRFRFGECRTSAYLVPADSQAVVTLDPALLPPDSVVPFTDPAYGKTWSLVELPVDPEWPQASELDPAAVVIRALLGEMKTRLALWTPTWDELQTFAGLWLDYDRLNLDDAGAALRWLLSAQGSVHQRARLTEAVIEAAADGVEGPAAVADRLRSRLGRSVLGPLAASISFTPVAVDDALAREAVEKGSSGPLLETFPELTAATDQLVVSSPALWRREVECLLRPLSDTVVVAAEEELAQLPLATSEPSA
jgi:hypothetical protein